MKLIDLKPKFLRYQGNGRSAHVDTIEEAQGVMFLCPKCFVQNGGSMGTHSVICWSESRGVPADITPGPGRWSMHGTNLHDLTLDIELGRTRSILLGPPCAWHGYVTNGEVTSE